MASTPPSVPQPSGDCRSTVAAMQTPPVVVPIRSAQGRSANSALGRTTVLWRALSQPPAADGRRRAGGELGWGNK